jgi:hypothetical protein
MTLVCRRAEKDAAMPGGVVTDAEVEYRKYMTLPLFGGGTHAMFSAEVDEIWHAHLLFSRNYMQFCQDVFGFFLHHEPTTEKRDEGNLRHAWTRFADHYEALFGELSYLWDAPPLGVHAAYDVPSRRFG